MSLARPHPMRAEALDVLVRDEPTSPALEHDDMVVRRLAASLAAVLVSDAAADRALVVLWRGASIVGAFQGDHVLTDLDGLPVAALGAALRGGSAPDIAGFVHALVESPVIDHEVVRDAAGACVGVVAVGAHGPLPAMRAARALARAAAALGGWARASVDGSSAALALIERIEDAIIVHDHELVLAANRAAVRLLGCDRPDAVAGMPLTMIFPRLPRLPFFAAELGMMRADRSVLRVSTRAHGLLLSGRGVRALVIEEAQPSMLGTTGIDPAPVIRDAAEALAPVLRRTGRVVVGPNGHLRVAVHPVPLRDVVELALLDAATALDEQAAADNRLEVGIAESPDGDVVIEITARGTLVAARVSAEPIGSAVCGARIGELGGDLEVATTVRDRRVIRLVLPQGVA